MRRRQLKQAEVTLLALPAVLVALCALRSITGVPEIQSPLLVPARVDRRWRHRLWRQLRGRSRGLGALGLLLGVRVAAGREREALEARQLGCITCESFLAGRHTLRPLPLYTVRVCVCVLHTLARAHWPWHTPVALNSGETAASHRGVNFPSGIPSGEVGFPMGSLAIGKLN